MVSTATVWLQRPTSSKHAARIEWGREESALCLAACADDKLRYCLHKVISVPSSIAGFFGINQ